MAVFKTLRVKEKDYAFRYQGNETLKEPARALFARFPLHRETFFRVGSDASYRDIDFTKIGQRDDKEIEKLFSVFITSYFSDNVQGNPDTLFNKVDIPAFIRECIDHFEDFYSETGENTQRTPIRSVDDFLALPQDAVYEIAKDLYTYARERDTFSMGESKA
jgi:hypothetical protein